MRSSAKPVGMLMAIGGSILLIGIIAWGLSGLSDDDLQTSGFILLLVLTLIVLLPIILGGVFMIIKGREELVDLGEVEQQRKLLNMVQSRGQVSINDLVLDLQTTRDKVHDSLTELVGRGLFSGYVDWKAGMLYSVEASKLQDRQTCPNCGGQLELAGKGMISCPYCGADIFLS
ncbi:MAG: zinc ribbon domain-containing protein [Chloroflexota bacterium]|nr:zinc ribbon domain-containing protein [Chloroflexota bacterium]